MLELKGAVLYPFSEFVIIIYRYSEIREGTIYSTSIKTYSHSELI